MPGGKKKRQINYFLKRELIFRPGGISPPVQSKKKTSNTDAVVGTRVPPHAKSMCSLHVGTHGHT